MKNIDAELEWVSSSKDAIKYIIEARHDAYLIDYRLDALTGLDVLQEVSALERTEPFILLTGVGDQGIERESLQLAASDYLVKKGLTSDMLARSLYYALGRKEQEKQRIEQLIELNKTKDEFISIASHQLRTPATTVKQYVAMVIEGIGGELNEQQRTLLQRAYDSNERQLATINDLLKVAQIDAGIMELGLKNTNVSQILTNLVEDFRPSFEQVGQELRSDITQNVQATIDENAFCMVIDNLLENAKKYSEPHTVTRLEVGVNSNYVEICIRDEGVGVEKPERLFQKFSRITNKLSNDVGGTGLGLYWAHSIAQLHGGNLTYEPNTPEGSVFTLKLPLM